MYIDYLKESQKLEEEINQVLQSLRKSQESEYKVAEERLHAQKYYLCNLYQQLDKERVGLACRMSNANPDILSDAIMDQEDLIKHREDQIKRELLKLKDMEEVAKGFGRTSKETLKEFFDPEVGD